MALDNIDIDVNNGLETSEARSVVGTDNETKSDVVELTEDEKRMEIMNTLINSQKYHNMLEVCTRLKFDLNGLIIMNMDPTELTHLNRNNVQSVVDDALEATRKFITESTTGVVLRSDGTIDVKESIAEAVDRGGVYDNGFVAPEITAEVRSMYEERLEKYLGEDKRLEQLYESINEFSNDISRDNNTFGSTTLLKFTKSEVDEFTRVFNLYGREAARRKLIENMFERKRTAVAKNPGAYLAYMIQCEYNVRDIELRTAPDQKAENAINANHDRNARLFAELMTDEEREKYLKDIGNGRYELTQEVIDEINKPENIVNYDIEAAREFYEYNHRLKELGRPWTFPTQVQGQIFAYLVSKNVNGFAVFRDVALAQISNRCPQLIEYDSKGKMSLNQEELKHFFKLQYPDMDFEEDTEEKIKALVRGRIMVPLARSVDNVMVAHTDEKAFMEERREEAAGEQLFRISKISTQAVSTETYTRNEIINELTILGRQLAQRDAYIEKLRAKHKDIDFDEDYIRGIASRQIEDSRLDDVDMSIIDTLQFTPEVKRKIETVRNDWLNDESFLAGFSGIIYFDKETNHLEINYDKVREEYNKRRVGIEVNGHLVYQEDFRAELYKRVCAYNDKKNGVNTVVSRDVSYSYLAKYTTEELLTMLRDNMPDFYNRITTDTTKNSEEGLSLLELQPKSLNRLTDIEEKRKFDYAYRVNGKVYTAMGVAKLFDEALEELKKNSKIWKKGSVSMESSIEDLIKAFPKKEKAIRTLFATKEIMEDFANFRDFAEFFENDSNKVNVGRLHRIINQKLKDGTITEENIKPQEQYTVLGRQYSKFALVVEYLNIKDFEGYNESSYFVENQDKLKKIEEIIKSAPEFKQYVDSEGNIQTKLLRDYKAFMKSKIGTQQYGYSSRPDDVVVNIGGKDYKQVEIPQLIVKLSRTASNDKNNDEIKRLLDYVKDNPELYGQEVSESLKSDIYAGEYSPELEQLSQKMRPKYVMYKSVLNREEVIRMLAEKHFGCEADDNKGEFDLLEFHKTGNIDEIPFRLLESLIKNKYSKDFADILVSQGTAMAINWNAVLKEYDQLKSNIAGRNDNSESLYRFNDKYYTKEGIMLQLIENMEKEDQLIRSGAKAPKKDKKDAHKLVKSAYSIIMNPKNYRDFAEYIEYCADNSSIGIASLRAAVNAIRQDEKKLAKCQGIDPKDLGKHYKSKTVNKEEVRLVDFSKMNSAVKEFEGRVDKHHTRTSKQIEQRDRAFHKIQGLSVYGTSKEIAERLFTEISSQAYLRKEKDKDKYIVSTLLDICDALKEQDPETAKFLAPGIISRISSNITMYKNLDLRDPDAQDIALGMEIGDDTFERFYNFRSETKNLTPEEQKDDIQKRKKLIARIVIARNDEVARNERKIKQIYNSVDTQDATYISQHIQSESEITAERHKELVKQERQEYEARMARTMAKDKAFKERQAREQAESAKTITDSEGTKTEIERRQEDMTVDVEGQNKALVEMAAERQEDLSKKPISDKESKDVLDKNGQHMNVAEPPQLDAEGKKIDGQESNNLGNKSNEQDASSNIGSKENQSNETFVTAGATDSEGSDTTSSASDNVHLESENNNLPAKESVFNRIKRGFFNFINNITGKGGKEKEVEDNSLPAEDKKASDHKENQETVMDFNERLQVEGATGKIQESDLTTEKNKTGEANAKNAGNPVDKKADNPGPEQEI